MVLLVRVDTKSWLFKECKERRFDACVCLHLKVKRRPSGNRYSKEKWNTLASRMRSDLVLKSQEWKGTFHLNLSSPMNSLWCVSNKPLQTAVDLGWVGIKLYWQPAAEKQQNPGFEMCDGLTEALNKLE